MVIWITNTWITETSEHLTFTCPDPDVWHSNGGLVFKWHLNTRPCGARTTFDTFKNKLFYKSVVCLEWPLSWTLNSDHLNTKQVWYSNGPNMSDYQIFQLLNSVLKTRQKNYVFWSKMSTIWMVRLVLQSENKKIR